MRYMNKSNPLKVPLKTVVLWRLAANNAAMSDSLPLMMAKQSNC